MRLSDNTSDYERIVQRFIDNKINVIRFNVTRYSHKKYWNDIEYIRQIYNSHNKDVGIMLDIPCPGNKFRSRLHDKQEIVIGSNYIFTSQDNADNAIYVPHEIIAAAQTGSTITVGDGELAFQISATAPTSIKAVALNSGWLRNGRAVYIENFSNYYYNEYTEEDYGELMRHVQPEYVVLSFAENPDHIRFITEKINNSVDKPPRIVSKIETAMGASQIASLLKVSDAVMIGRGDMALTSDPADLGIMQDNIIKTCIQQSKPVYVATDIMNSLLTNYVPRRSDIIDAHHIISTSANGIVLSAALSISDSFSHATGLINAIADKNTH